MAITRTQIARQLYQAGGGADFGAPDKAKDRASKGYGNVGGGKAASKGFKQDAGPGEQSPEVYGASGPYDSETAKAAAIAQGKFKKKNPIQKAIENYTGKTRKTLYNIFPNNPTNELDFLRSLPASQRALLSPALRAKLEAFELDEDQDLLDTAKTKFTFDEFEELRKFQPTEGLNFAEYAAKFKGAPGLLYSGDVGNLIKIKNPDGTFRYERRTDDGPNQPIIPVDSNATLPGFDVPGDKDTTEEEPFMLARAFRADGGRIGLQEGGGIEQRLEQLGGDVTSAEQMLQGINKRLQTAESSLGSGGGGLGTLATLAGSNQPFNPGNFQPALPDTGFANVIAQPSGGGQPFMGRPIMQPLLDQPLGQPLPATLETAQPGPNPFGIINSLTDPRGPAFDTMENAYKNAVDSSAEMKRIGRLDQLDVLGGRLSFEDYKKNFSMDDKGFVTRNPGSTPLGMQSQGGGMGSPIQQAVGMADGGRIGFAYGDTAEDNAMQASGIMGLPMNENPAGVKELDLRETGGFIPPVGVKEKADDIPAMLSNNEFVFTADAVRGMGDGNVNVGAQRMYDMMKKLENGGRV
jgi:hypothetical protein